jgi:glutathione-regulated potassium-efflux system ancillary protein KefC
LKASASRATSAPCCSGVLLAGDQKAKELARNLLYFKDLFLVGFFLSIGLGGWPGPELMTAGVILGVLALLKPLLYFPLFTRFHVAPRTALLASNSLANHSEFGLIVIAIAASAGLGDGNDWSGAMSIAIAVSFAAAAPLNRSVSLACTDATGTGCCASNRTACARSAAGHAQCEGAGAGHGQYRHRRLRGHRPQLRPAVLGVDDNDRKLAAHRAMHRRVAAADASDPDFWHRVALDKVELVMLALTNHQENMLVADSLPARLSPAASRRWCVLMRRRGSWRRRESPPSTCTSAGRRGFRRRWRRRACATDACRRGDGADSR